MAIPVAEPDGIAVPEHDVVGAGAAIHRLVEVIAHGVAVGQALKIRSVAMLYVVKAEGCRAFPVVFAVGEYSVLKFAGWASPLVPAPTVTSTQEKSFALQPEGCSQ